MRRKPYLLLAVLSLALGSACARRVATAPPPSPPQPAIAAAPIIPGGAHHAGPASLYPDPGRTPGFSNPDITQANISKNICNPSWSTKSIRPPASYTTGLKLQQMKEWSLPGSPADYEEDHF